MSLSSEEIRKMTSEERVERLKDLRLELMKLRMQARVGTIENPGRIRTIRKTIARILTIEAEEKKKKGEAK
ncbi:MAG: 50S ribosomal protein L29 [Desulfurococcales archaeon]|uniref:Large ribosomal subunit protein uL29 n=1 Tax=Fervidicoccus fontis TaxID=683846 RepID=A0A7J3SJI6_9CREN|nr:50S ribosomal protein L29 [Thermoprotei archaeon]NAY89642.1 50S ribosomal protein L29 [Desulfurococcales archaeon]